MKTFRGHSALARAACGFILAGIAVTSQFATAQSRSDGNETLAMPRDQGPARVVLTAPVVVSTGDYSPAAQRLVYTQTGFPGCTASVSVLAATSAAPAPILAAGGVIVPRGTNVMEISFDSLTRLRSSSGQGQAQIGAVLRVRESAGPGAWVTSDLKITGTQSGVAGVAPSLANFTMWGPLALQAFVGVTPGLAYDIEVVAYYSPAVPHTYNADRADLCNGRLVVRL